MRLWTYMQLDIAQKDIMWCMTVFSWKLKGRHVKCTQNYRNSYRGMLKSEAFLCFNWKQVESI